MTVTGASGRNTSTGGSRIEATSRGDATRRRRPIGHRDHGGEHEARHPHVDHVEASDHPHAGLVDVQPDLLARLPEGRPDREVVAGVLLATREAHLARMPHAVRSLREHDLRLAPRRPGRAAPGLPHGALHPARTGPVGQRLWATEQHRIDGARTMGQRVGQV